MNFTGTASLRLILDIHYSLACHGLKWLLQLDSMPMKSRIADGTATDEKSLMVYSVCRKQLLWYQAASVFLSVCLSVCFSGSNIVYTVSPLGIIGIWVGGTGRAAAPLSGQSIIFWANAEFFGQKPAAKNEKETFFVFIKWKIELISSSEVKCPKSGIFSNNCWVGWVG